MLCYTPVIKDIFEYQMISAKLQANVLIGSL